jgi:hypothetical protein
VDSRSTRKTGRHTRACLAAMSLLASHWRILSNLVSCLCSTNIIVQARGTRQHLVRPAISLRSHVFFFRLQRNMPPPIAGQCRLGHQQIRTASANNKVRPNVVFISARLPRITRLILSEFSFAALTGTHCLPFKGLLRKSFRVSRRDVKPLLKNYGLLTNELSTSQRLGI